MPFVHPQHEEAPCCDDRDPLIMEFYWGRKMEEDIMSAEFSMKEICEKCIKNIDLQSEWNRQLERTKIYSILLHFTVNNIYKNVDWIHLTQDSNNLSCIVTTVVFLGSYSYLIFPCQMAEYQIFNKDFVSRKHLEICLTLYAPCIILQYVYNTTRCT